MSTSPSTTHDELVALLWELKAAWQAHGGGDVLLANLLLDRTQLDRFLSDAAASDDTGIRTIAARIVTLRATLDGGKDLDSKAAQRPTPASPRPPAGGASGLDRVRAASVVLASVLVSMAAGRYLVAEPSAHGGASWSAPTVAQAAVTSHPESSVVAVEVAPTGTGAVPAESAPATAAAPTLAESDVVLRIHGSNTVGEKLSPALVEAFLKSRAATDVVRAPATSPVEKTVLARLPDRAQPIAIEIHAHGSSSAFSDLAAGSADLGQSSRRIKPAETADLGPKLGDLSKPGSEHVVALDGLAIIVHPDNPVQSLSIGQIAEIFAGRIKNWSEVGGTDSAIALYARDDASGTWDTFKHLVLAPSLVDLDPGARRYESSGDLSNAVAADARAIGFVGLPYVQRTKLLGVSAEAGSLALLPTPFTVATEDYPLSRRLYFYAPRASDNAMVRDFVDFALSAEGQEVVKKIGLVAQSVGLEKPSVETRAPADYRRTAEQAERLSLNFRFEAGSDDLDAKAQRDLDRVVEYLAKDRAREVLLLGFTDDRGATRANADLSKKRAQVVASALESRGVFSREVLGFGEALPVASNTSEEGRNRNRRVEVWVR